MHYIPYLFLGMVGLLGLTLLLGNPQSDYQWLGYTGAGSAPVSGTLVRLLGAGLIVLALLPLVKRRR